MSAQPAEDVIEHTLAVFRDVSAFKIPPRAGSGGIKSGEWRTDDKIFTGRLVLTDCGSTCELRLSDPSTNELFAVCPVGRGERNTCVEAAADSSRNFVIRVVDPATRRHAFLGMGFIERGDAFDFNVALSDWEKHMQAPSSASAAPSASAAQPQQPQHDFSLKAGETIKVKRISGSGGGFLAGLGSGSGSGPLLGTLAPPPAAGGGFGLLPPPPSPAAAAAPVASGGFGLAPPPAPSGGLGLAPSPSASSSSQATVATAGSNQPAALVEEEWTAFS